MTTTMNRQFKRWAHLAVALGFSFGAAACDELLEVDLPAQLGDDALEDPAGAESVVITLIEHFEQAVDLMVWQFHGHEDGGEIYLASPGTNAGDMTYGTDASGGPRSSVQLGTTSGYEGWFQELTTSIRFSRFLHQKLADEWTVAQVPLRARYLAFSSLYEGAALTRLGESMCEVALESGPLQAPNDVLALAETTLGRALTELAALPGGDVALPYGISTSAKAMAYGLRAQARWMKGDLTGAASDAAQVPNGFTAYVTRDANAARNNKAYFAGTENRYAELYDVVNWWRPANRTNPATGQQWPAVIPFTGYVFLGILPDGRAVRDDGLPIRRTGANPGGTGGLPVMPGIEPTAVADTRVPFFLGQVAGAGGAAARAIHQKYANAGADIPLVNWKEMILIRAEQVGGQGAIDLVNQIRTADGLPRVTYITGATATPEQIRYMIIEERRRSLFLEGRFLMTKIKNTDLLWFPRAQGQTPGAGRALGGGVRFHMPNSEYLYNPNTNGDLNLRGTKCAVNERPVITV
jgi:hypothetical protein